MGRGGEKRRVNDYDAPSNGGEAEEEDSVADEEMVKNWDGEPCVGVGRETEGCPSAAGQWRVCLLLSGKACGAGGRRRGPFIPAEGGAARSLREKQAADERRRDEEGTRLLLCGTCPRRIRLTSPSYPPTDFGRRSVKLLTAPPSSPPLFAPP